MGGVFADQGAHGAPQVGQKAVTTAGTPVQLAATTATGCHTIVVRAKIANTGKIYVGPTSAGTSSTLGFELGAGDAVTIVTSSPSNIWLDCSVNGEGVSYLAT